MWETSSKKYLPALAVLCLLFSLALSPSCYADVTLTDSEAEDLILEMNTSRMELEKSKKELTEARNSLETLQTQLNEQKEALSEVETAWNEQKESSEKQLEEAEKKARLPWILTIFSGLGNIGLLIGLICALI